MKDRQSAIFEREIGSLRGSCERIVVYFILDRVWKKVNKRQIEGPLLHVCTQYMVIIHM